MAFLGKPLSVARRLVARVRRSRLDDELREEMTQHIALRRQQLIDEGMDPRDAAFEARRLFGNVMVLREETREMWGFRWIETIGQDVRFGARLLRRAPVFTFTALASLAIAIGSAAAVFSLADGVLFRRLPVAQPDQLVLFRWISGREFPFESLSGTSAQSEQEISSTAFSFAAYDAFRTRLSDRLDVFAFADLYTVSLAIEGRPYTGAAQVVSGNYFSALGLSPAAGRLLGPPDDSPDAPPAAIIGFDFWQQRLGGDAAAIGRTIVVNGVSFTIAGVLPRGFTGTLQVGQPCDVMVPLVSYKAITHTTEDPLNPNFWWVMMMARLEPGATIERERASADLLLRQSIAAAQPSFPADRMPRIRLEPGAQGQVEDRTAMSEPLGIMTGVVVLVLLVACANLASLLLARGRARGREVTVRTAIGAPRSRIVRQLLTEGLLLGLLASAVGLVLAQWIASALLPALSENSETLVLRYGVNLRILAFTCGLGIASSILFALLPALRTTVVSVTPALQEASRGTVGARGGVFAGGALVVVQVALSLLLLSAATLLVWSAQRLQRVDPGFNARNLLTFGIDTSLNGYDAQRTRAFVARALDQLRALPGVTHATVTSYRLIANSSEVGVSRPEHAATAEPNSAEARALMQKYRTWRLAVDDAFLETFGIPVLRGRNFPAELDPAGPRVALVNETLARQLFGTTDVLGRRFVNGLRPGGQSYEIIGVVKDVRYTSLRRDPPPTAYLAYQQNAVRNVTFAVRTAGDPLLAADSVRETMRRVDAAVALFGMRTQQEQIRRSLARELLFGNLALLLGGVALALSAIGLYGLVAYTVTRRTAEIGVRMALGAERRHVHWMVLRQSLMLVAAGFALGIPGSLASTRLLESLLFGLDPRDPRALIAASLVMVAVVLVAAYVPARRASRIDPLIALRSEG